MKGIKLKPMTVRLLMLLIVVASLSVPTMAQTMSQDRLSQGGLFCKGPVSDNPQRDNAGGLFNPSTGGYDITTQHFGSDVYGGYNITTQHFGHDAPLGGGCLVLTLAGAAYALKKRKNNKKKTRE